MDIHYKFTNDSFASSKDSAARPRPDPTTPASLVVGLWSTPQGNWWNYKWILESILKWTRLKATLTAKLRQCMKNWKTIQRQTNMILTTQTLPPAPKPQVLVVTWKKRAFDCEGTPSGLQQTESLFSKVIWMVKRIMKMMLMSKVMLLADIVPESKWDF